MISRYYNGAAFGLDAMVFMLTLLGTVVISADYRLNGRYMFLRGFLQPKGFSQRGGILKQDTIVIEEKEREKERRKRGVYNKCVYEEDEEIQEEEKQRKINELSLTLHNVLKNGDGTSGKEQVGGAAVEENDVDLIKLDPMRLNETENQKIIYPESKTEENKEEGESSEVLIIIDDACADDKTI